MQKPFKLPDSPWLIQKPFPLTEKKAAIIGGGLAGCACAYSLAKRGWQVHIYESGSDIAQRTSGNPAGVLSVQLSTHNNVHNRFYQTSYYYAITQLKKLLKENNKPWKWCGVLQLAFDEKEQQAQQQLIEKNLWPHHWLKSVSAEEASEISGIKCHTPGLYFPNAGWIQPYALCQRQLQHPNIHLHTLQTIQALHREENKWFLENHLHQISEPFPVIILANAFNAQNFFQTKDFPLRAVRGQVSFLSENDYSKQLKTVLSYEGYMTPAFEKQHCIGATFYPNDDNLTFRDEDQEKNLQMLEKTLPELYESFTNTCLSSGKVGIRCQTPDYLPIVGPVPQRDFFIEHFSSALGTGNSHCALPMGDYWPGLYVSLAHGSRGLTTTAFCAEIIASQINGEILPVDKKIIEVLHPSRFLIRDLKRRLI